MLVLLVIAIGIAIVAGLWQLGGFVAEHRRDRRRRREIENLERLFDSSEE